MTENSSVRKYVAELIGTFVLVLVGCGSAVLAGSYIGNTGVSFAFGLSLLTMVYTIGLFLGVTSILLCPCLCWLRAK